MFTYERGLWQLFKFCKKKHWCYPHFSEPPRDFWLWAPVAFRPWLQICILLHDWWHVCGRQSWGQCWLPHDLSRGKVPCSRPEVSPDWRWFMNYIWWNILALFSRVSMRWGWVPYWCMRVQWSAQNQEWLKIRQVRAGFHLTLRLKEASINYVYRNTERNTPTELL